MLADQERLFTLIRCLSSSHVSSAERELEQLEEDPGFLASLLLVLQQRSPKQQEKLSTVAVINKYIQKNYDSPDCPCDPLTQRMFRRVFFDWQIPHKIKAVLGRSLLVLFESWDEEQLSQWINSTLSLSRACSDYQTQTGTWQQNEWNIVSGQDLQAGCLCSNLLLVLLVNTVYDTDQIFKLVRGSLSRVSWIKDTIPSLDQQGNLTTCFRSRSICLESTLDTWVQIFDALILSSDADKQLLALQVATNLQLLDIFSRLISYGSCSPTAIALDYQAKEQCRQLNRIKNKVFQALSKMIQRLIKTQQPIKELLNLVQSQIPTIVLTLSNLANFPKLIEEFGCENIIETLVDLLLKFNSVQELTIEVLRSICAEAIFPLMFATSVEREEFEEDPEEYMKMIEDCCDRQELDNFKTKVCALLQVVISGSKQLCDSVYKYCVSCIEVAVGVKSSVESQQALPLQATIMCLCLLNYKSCQYPNESQYIGRLLLYPILKMQRPFELSRLFNYLSFCYNDIYPEIKTGASWFQYALNYGEHQGAKAAALDFIYSMGKDCFNEAFIKTFADKIVVQLKQDILWTILRDIVTEPEIQLSLQAATYILNRLCERIDINIAKYNSLSRNNAAASVESALKIVKHLCCLRHIIAVPSFNEEIEKVIIRFETFRDMGVEEEVLKIVLVLLKNSFLADDRLTAFILEKLSIFSRQNSHQKSICPIILTHLVGKGSDKFSEDIWKLCLEGFQTFLRGIHQNPNSEKYRLGLANFLLLLLCFYSRYPMWSKNLETIVTNLQVIMAFSEDLKVQVAHIQARSFLCLLVLSLRTELAQRLLQFDFKIFNRCGEESSAAVGILSQLLFKEVSVDRIKLLLTCLQKTLSALENNQPSIQNSENKSLVIRIERTVNYSVAFNHMWLPFEFALAPFEKAKQLLQQMNGNNAALLANILESITQKTILHRLLNFSFTQKRVIWTNIGTKDEPGAAKIILEPQRIIPRTLSLDDEAEDNLVGRIQSKRVKFDINE